jgi:hypothetical protein
VSDIDNWASTFKFENGRKKSTKRMIAAAIGFSLNDLRSEEKIFVVEPFLYLISYEMFLDMKMAIKKK